MKYVDLNGLGTFLQGIKEMFSNYVTQKEVEDGEKVIAASLNELKETKQDVIEDLSKIREESQKVKELLALQEHINGDYFPKKDNEDNEMVIAASLNELKNEIEILKEKMSYLEGHV